MFGGLKKARRGASSRDVGDRRSSQQSEVEDNEDSDSDDNTRRSGAGPGSHYTNSIPYGHNGNGSPAAAATADSGQERGRRRGRRPSFQAFGRERSRSRSMSVTRALKKLIPGRRSKSSDGKKQKLRDKMSKKAKKKAADAQSDAAAAVAGVDSESDHVDDEKLYGFDDDDDEHSRPSSNKRASFQRGRPSSRTATLSSADSTEMSTQGTKPKAKKKKTSTAKKKKKKSTSVSVDGSSVDPLTASAKKKKKGKTKKKKPANHNSLRSINFEDEDVSIRSNRSDISDIATDFPNKKPIHHDHVEPAQGANHDDHRHHEGDASLNDVPSQDLNGSDNVSRFQKPPLPPVQQQSKPNTSIDHDDLSDSKQTLSDESSANDSIHSVTDRHRNNDHDDDSVEQQKTKTTEPPESSDSSSVHSKDVSNFKGINANGNADTVELKKAITDAALAAALARTEEEHRQQMDRKQEELALLKQSLEDATLKAVSIAEESETERKNFKEATSTLNSMKDELAALSEESAQLKKSIEEKDDDATMKDARIAALEQTVDEYFDKIEVLEDKLIQAEEEVLTLTNAIKDMEDQEQFEPLNDSNSLDSRESPKDKEAREREQAYEERMEELERRERELEEMERNLELEKERSESLIEEMELEAEEKSDRLAELEETVSKYENELSQVDKLQIQLEEKSVLVENLQLQLDESTHKHEEATAKSEASLREGLLANQQQFEQDIQVQTAKVFELQLKNEEMEQELFALKAESEEMASTDGDAQDVKSRFEEEKLRLQQESEQMKQDLEKQIEDLQQEKEEFQQQLEERQREYEEEIAEKTNELSELEHTIDDLRLELEENDENYINSLLEEIEVLKRANDSIPAVREELEDAIIELENKDALILELRKDLEDVNEELEKELDANGSSAGAGNSERLLELEEELEKMKNMRKIEQQEAIVKIRIKDDTISFLQDQLLELTDNAAEGANKVPKQPANTETKARMDHLEDEIDHWKSINCELEDEVEMWKERTEIWRDRAYSCGYECDDDSDLDIDDDDGGGSVGSHVSNQSASIRSTRTTGSIASATSAFRSGASVGGGSTCPESPGGSSQRGGHALANLWTKLTATPSRNPKANPAIPYTTNFVD